ncbi:MAG: hypothetical protein AAF678_02925 [Pseudomonadota bacterium]
MDRKVTTRRLAAAGGTFLCAWAIGYFMQATAQSGATTDATAPAIEDPGFEASDARTVLPDATPLVHPAQPDLTTAALFSDQHAVILAWASAEAPPSRAVPAPLVAPARSPQLADLNTPSDGVENLQTASAPVSGCDVRLDASKSLAAMARLTLDAPCLPETSFTVHHSGMMFSDVTDATGRWTMEVPALAEQALFILSFDNGESAVTSALIDTVELYERYVLQWQGRDGLELHALEAGAFYGGDGHVWSGAAREPSAAVHGDGGFITRLGPVATQAEREGHTAQIYTVLPALRSSIEVHAEISVHEANCAQDIEAQVLIQRPRGGLSARDLVFALPDCASVGEKVVLSNLNGS